EKDKTPYYFVNTTFNYNSPVPLFRYAGPDPAYPYFVAAATVAEKKKDKDRDTYLENYREYKYAPGSFRFFVRLALQDYFLRGYVNKFNIQFVMPDHEKDVQKANKYIQKKYGVN